MGLVTQACWCICAAVLLNTQVRSAVVTVAAENANKGVGKMPKPGDDSAPANTGSGLPRRVPDFMNITLTYFDIRGLGEPIRLYLSALGVPFNERIVSSCGDNGCEGEIVEWNIFKSEGIDSGLLPFGQVPLLSIGNTAEGFENAPELDMVQSHAILRFFSKQGYNTRRKLTTTQEMFFDMVAGGVQDVRSRYSDLVYDSDITDEKINFYIGKGSENEANPKSLRKWFRHFEKLLQRGEEFFHISQEVLLGEDPVSYAPALVWDMIDTNLRVDARCLSGLPRLQSLHQNFAKLPGVASYLSSSGRRQRANGASAFYDTPTLPPRFDVTYDSSGAPSISPQAKRKQEL